MTTDYRALCAELLSALENEGYAHWAIPPDEDKLCLRARAALAQPAPEGPTDEELRLMAIEWSHRTPVEFARAVLARWGRPATVPCDKSSTPGDQ